MKSKKELEIYYKYFLIFSCLIFKTYAAELLDSGSYRPGLGSGRTNLLSFSSSHGSRNGGGSISIGSTKVGYSLPTFNTSSNSFSKKPVISVGNGKTVLSLRSSLGHRSPSSNTGLESLDTNSAISNSKAFSGSNTPIGQTAHNSYYNPPAKIPSTFNSLADRLFKQPYLKIAKFVTALTKDKNKNVSNIHSDLSASPVDFINNFPRLSSFNHKLDDDYNHVKKNKGIPTIFHHKLFQSHQVHKDNQNQALLNYDQKQILSMIALAAFIIRALT